MARMAYTPVPHAVNQDERITALPPLSRLVYLTLRIGSDSHGRFRAGRMALRIVCGILDPAMPMQSTVASLIDAGLVRAWVGKDGQSYGEIVDYDEGLTANMIKRRGVSEIQDPPIGGGRTPESLMTDSRLTHECFEAQQQRAPRLPLMSDSRLTHESLIDHARGRAEPSRAKSPPTEGRRTDARVPIDGCSDPTHTAEADRPVTSTPPPAPPTHPAPPAPPRQQPDSLERVSPGLPIDDTLPPLGDTAQGLVDELVRRITATPMGTGLHSPGFFGRGGDSGMVAFEAKLRLLQERNPQAVVAASRGFWPAVDREGGPDHWPRDPTRRLEQWLADKGHRVPFAAQVMREVAGG